MVISGGVAQFKHLGSVLVTDGRLDVELNVMKGKSVGRFQHF